MDDLKQCSLDELIELVIQERLIDACECNNDRVVIVQGPMRFVLNPARAHAFLRGVIKGMSIRYRRRWACDSDRPQTEEPERVDVLKQELPQPRLIDSFGYHLLTMRYEAALCPFGPSRTGMMLWFRHSTFTTSN